MSDNKFPILDWARFEGGSDRGGFVRDLGAACRNTGFFFLANHGISRDLIDRTFSMSDAFFGLPEDRKAPLDIRRFGTNRGWVREGSEHLDDTTDQLDRKEAFNIGLELAHDDPRIVSGQPFRGLNEWPDLPGFKVTLLAYYDAVHRLGVQLHRPIALDLGLDEAYFAPRLDAPLATLRLLRYPASNETDSQMGAGAHSDYGSITLLLTDGEPGLQVRPRDGDWINVPQVPDAFIVNIGDCLMRWTNDIYVSTPHRVLAPQRVRRSIAFFLDPNPDAVISALPGTGPAKYPPVTGADYLRQRLDAPYTSEPIT